MALGWLFGPVARGDRETFGKEAALFGSTLGPSGVLEPMLTLDRRDASVRQAVQANHNPPAASSAAIARERCFLFTLFGFESCYWIVRAFLASWLSIWNEAGEFWCEAPAIRNEAGFYMILDRSSFLIDRLLLQGALKLGGVTGPALISVTPDGMTKAFEGFGDNSRCLTLPGR